MYDCIMAGRHRTWEGYKEDALHKVTITWPSSLWKDLQHLALEENTSATALAIQAVEMLLDTKRKEQTRKSKQARHN
jgi:hypothetical protein